MILTRFIISSKCVSNKHSLKDVNHGKINSVFTIEI
jgi:hypothetical protein